MMDNHQPPKFYTIGEAHKRKRGRPPGQPGQAHQARKTGSRRDTDSTPEEKEAVKQRRAEAEAGKPEDMEAACKREFEKSVKRHGWTEDSEKRNAFQFTECFKDVYKAIFQPPENITLPNNRRSLLDYSNAEEVAQATEAYISICRMYGIMPTAEAYCTMTGIGKDAFYKWLNGTARNNLDENVTLSHKEIAKSIRQAAQEYVRGALATDRTGILAIANNDSFVGLEWEKKKIQDAAEVLTPQIAAQDIAQRLAARTAGSLEAPKKPQKLLDRVIPHDDSSDDDDSN